MSASLVFIGIAAVTGTIGVGKAIHAGVEQNAAKELNLDANTRIENASFRLEHMRKQCGEALQNLGDEKLFVLNNSVSRFIESFEKLKNVDFQTSIGLEEIHKLHIDHKEFDELKEMNNFALAVSKGTVAGVAGGAMAAYGAYSVAAAYATASTGTAIATLNGVAASNATLAFFGGGSVAAGGMGVAGGTAVLGGVVAGTALMVMGIIVEAQAGKQLEEAKANATQADEICEELENGSLQCIAIRRRTSMFYNLLARMDSYLLPMIFKMEEIIENEGFDYSKYSDESKKVIATAASTAVTVKRILDTPILTEDGSIDNKSELIMKEVTKIENK